MKLSDFQDLLQLVPLTGTDADLSFDGVYAGDLLSRCMSHVNRDDLWLTIMNNLNVIAVASLTECAAVVLAEGVELPQDVAQVARDKGVAVFSTPLTVYEICTAIARYRS